MGQVNKVFLFLETHGPDVRIRPVLWDNPDAAVIPSGIPASKAAFEWLIKNGLPQWIPANGKKCGRLNCEMLARNLGYWPEPFEADVTDLMDFTFNDSLECLK